MSSDGNSTGFTAAAADKMFFCYKCKRRVTISISSTDDPFCSLCNEGFLEEYEEPSPNPTPNLNPGGLLSIANPFSSLLPLVGPSASPSPSSTVMDFMNPSFLGLSMQVRSTQQQQQRNPGDFDPVSFLQNHLQHLESSSGAHVHFVIVNHPSDSTHRMPGYLGDYFFGPGFEQLIQEITENHPNRNGTPPASKSAIDGLSTVKVTMDMLKSDMNQCAVCIDEFEDGSDVKQMPCKHVFHQDCLLPWLKLHNSCPVCRFELPTDDQDYENMTREGQTSGNGQGSVEGQETPRRFIIQLPSPFRGQDGSGSPENGAGGANLETRQEDLD